MAGKWDDALKKLVDNSPQDFVSWIEPGAIFEKALPQMLKAAHLYADALLQVLEHGQPALKHIEFQSTYDARIGERLLEYNILASRENDYLPVSSYVIYLKDCGVVPQSPYIETSRAGKEIKRFYYESIELERITAADMIQLGLVGLLPLLPLTHDGARHEVIETMIAQLRAAHKQNALWIGYSIASKVMAPDLRWLKRRFSVFGDFLRDTPVYQEVLEEGREEGLEAWRHTFVRLVEMRFPALTSFAQHQVEGVKSPATLEDATVQIVAAQDAQEAVLCLLALRSDEKKN